jgi:hypothetical protein
MIPVIDKPEVINSGEPILRIDMRQMDPEDIQTMLEQSRNGFYSNKELAPIREYSTNARDAHVRAGKPTLPIRVTLPTEMEPEFKVRDFGSGLSYETIADVYFKYWKSTKRFTNDENGCLGIGSKSAFSYTAIYTVTTWCEGMKTVITGQKSGFADVIYRQLNITNEPDGVEITIPVLQKDIEKFTTEAMNLFKYWDIRPEFVNSDPKFLETHFSTMNSKPFLSGEGWAIRPAGYFSCESVVLMGNVPYPIDWSQVRNSLPKEISVKIQGIFEFLEANLTTLEFPNGTLAFTPNRESLQYNDVTVKALSDKLVLIFDTLLNMITSKVSEATNLWDAKMIYNKVFRKELEGFDKGMFYGGNLDAVERLLQTRIQWKGVSLKNGLFTDLNRWDKNDGQVDSHAKYISPLFSTYVKNENKDNVKVCRCNRKHNNKMIASPKSLVIIQDTRKARYVKAEVAYYLLEKGGEYSQVYVLNLTNPKVKEAFFRNYFFDSVPALYISQLETMLAPYVKARGGNGGGGGNFTGSQPLYCPYFEVAPLRDNGVYRMEWNTAVENARGITGGVFVIYKTVPGRGNGMTLNGQWYDKSDARDIVQSIHDLCQATDHKLARVYGIHQRTADSVWFKEAVENGDWMPLNEVMTDLVEELDETTLKRVRSYQEFSDEKRLGSVAAKKLLSELTNKSSPFYQHCQLIVDLIPSLCLYDALKYFTKHLGNDKFVCAEMKASSKEVVKRYSMIFRHINSSAIQNCDKKERYYKLEGAELTEIVEYINLVDSHLTK